MFFVFVFQERNCNGSSIGIDSGDGSIKCRNLVAFDFDHTVVDDNTDIVVRDLIAKDKIPEEVKFLYTSSGWIPYMQAIFKLLHANAVRRNDMFAAIENIPEVNGMKDLIRRLYETQDTDVIVVSDSNSQFIGHWCRHNGITEYVKDVFTNPAEFDADEVLKIQPYHHQTTCSLSSVNLCKGSILETYLQEQQKSNGVAYKKIFYVGDGNNDLCPILRLAEDDVGCARKGYRLQKELQSLKSNAMPDAADEDPKTDGRSVDPEIFVWNDGNELAEFIMNKI